MTSTATVARRLLQLTLPGDRVRLVPGLALLLAATAAGLLQPWPLKLVVDSVLGSLPPPAPLAAIAAMLPTSPAVSLLVVLAAGLVALQAVVGTLTMVGTNLLVAIGLRMVFRLRSRLFDHVQRLSLAFHDATPVGDSLYRVTWDTYAAQSLVNSAVIPAVTATATLVGIAIVMLSRDWTIAAAALAVAVPLTLLIRRLDRPLSEHALRVHERESAVSSRVQETLTGIRAVQAFGREALEHAHFERQAEASLRAHVKLIVLQTGSHALIGSIMAAGTAAVILLAGRQALAGRLTPGDVVLLAAYVAMLYKPLETLAYTAVAVQAAAAGGRRVLQVLDAVPDVTDAPEAMPLRARPHGEIAFEAVSFAYRPGVPALRDVTLRIAPGETLAVVGPSGAGKSTLASLLVRFYDPTAGRITLDGRDLRSITLASLRDQVALVLQEPLLFGASVRENIAYGRADASEADILAAARAAGAHDFITALPAGYKTPIGERGVSLSGGQRQRLAIARAFVKDAPMLILDEPTSALDAESEAALLAALERLMQGRTTLIIAHRLSTLRNAARIAVLRDGALVAVGTHEALLAESDLYSRLWRLQHDAAVVAAR
ncbi:MAG TPA: ABC transporter ATP-binding protein [Methylomirabilota bacterium]|nr:ABC transporter ATP-binding protein [Methylomirabilota bacterium]